MNIYQKLASKADKYDVLYDVRNEIRNKFYGR